MSQSSQETTSFGVFFNNVTGHQTITLLKRDSCEICEVFKNTLCYWTFTVGASDSFRFPGCNIFLKKRFRQICFSVNFSKFFRTSFDRTSLDDCFLSLSVNFEKFFTEKLLISWTSYRISTWRYGEKLFFTGAFQAFFTKTRSGHSKAFIYLKSLKIICKEVTL